jgi:uncharacterized iron-regulated membrane protein
MTGIAIIAESERVRLNQSFMKLCYQVHFGRFIEPFVLAWALAALAVPALTVTGLVMWWNRPGPRHFTTAKNSTAARHLAGPPSSEGSAT